MKLKAGEVSRILGMSTETIRYYVEEGLITPTKNPGNNYWEYSPYDILVMTDLLFYRDMGLPVADIKKIVDGIPLEEIGAVIQHTMDNLQEQMNELSRMHSRLKLWQDGYVGDFESAARKCNITMMPSYLYIIKEYDCYENIAGYLEEIAIPKDQWGNLSVSFFMDERLPENERDTKWFLSVVATDKLVQANEGGMLKEPEKRAALSCYALRREDIGETVENIKEYARQKELKLTGEFYGWEQENFYVNHKRCETYLIYAPLL